MALDLLEASRILREVRHARERPDHRDPARHPGRARLDQRADGLAFGSLAAIQQRFDAVGHQFSHLDKRITNVEEILVGTATSLGVDARGSRQRVIRSEGEIAELKAQDQADAVISARHGHELDPAVLDRSPYHRNHA